MRRAVFVNKETRLSLFLAGGRLFLELEAVLLKHLFGRSCGARSQYFVPQSESGSLGRLLSTIYTIRQVPSEHCALAANAHAPPLEGCLLPGIACQILFRMVVSRITSAHGNAYELSGKHTAVYTL